mmetsp:Transcript_18093/g.29963  ORF Transcript_18093/g.29963 Transcript_18093/m.29963 type:complete len:200 (+) Transcript_18093:44-643(+)
MKICTSLARSQSMQHVDIAMKNSPPPPFHSKASRQKALLGNRESIFGTSMEFLLLDKLVKDVGFQPASVTITAKIESQTADYPLMIPSSCCPASYWTEKRAQYSWLPLLQFHTNLHDYPHLTNHRLTAYAWQLGHREVPRDMDRLLHVASPENCVSCAHRQYKFRQIYRVRPDRSSSTTKGSRPSPCECRSRMGYPWEC